MKKFTKLACDYIEVDSAVFDDSMAKVMNGGETTKEQAQEFANNSSAIRKELDNARNPVTRPK